MINYEIGDYIREARKRAGLNQEQLAELASLNRVTIAKYESGKVEPGARAISRIADALEISVDELLGRTQPDESKQEDEIYQLRDTIRRNPNIRTLFDLTKNAAPEHINAAIAVFKALEPQTQDYYPDEPND